MVRAVVDRQFILNAIEYEFAFADAISISADYCPEIGMRRKISVKRIEAKRYIS